ATGVLPGQILGTLNATSTSLSLLWPDPPIGQHDALSRLIIGDLNKGPARAIFAATTFWAYSGLDGSFPGWTSEVRADSRSGFGESYSLYYPDPPPGAFVFAIVPEPGTFGLATLAIGGASLIAFHRRKRPYGAS